MGMMAKKGQVKMAENIAVMIIFIFLIVIGLIFYATYKRGALREEQAELEVQKAIEVAARIEFLPELQCSTNGIVRSNCVDLLKVQALADTNAFENYRNQLYFGLLGFSTIELKQIFPETNNFMLYDFPKTDFVTKELIPVPVKVYDPLNRRTTMGIIEVTVYG